MAYIKWDDKLLINISVIDNQHQKLYELTNRLHAELLVGRGDKVLGEILTSLVDYVKVHFAEEENYMEKYNYPHYEKHKIAHKEFISKIRGYIMKYKDKTPLLAREILIYLRGWYEEHIINIDKIFGAFLHETGNDKIIEAREKATT
ncbi:bacteriohemerythrin [Candidatus Latescibacterota bacterium]